MSLISKLAWFFWPVETKEQKKTFFMLLVLFFVSFVYSILRTLKITILLADPTLPSQAVSYLKIFGIMPAALVFTWLAIRMQSLYGQKMTFLGMNFLFATLFAILALYILPYQDFYRLHFSGTHELIALVNSWYITVFYVAAEMWSSIMLNMLCWGIIIEVTDLKDSKRLYGLFSLAGNLATYAAGLWGSSTIDNQIRYFYNLADHAIPTWEQSLFFQMVVLWGVQAVIALCFQIAISSQKIEHQKVLNKKVRLGFWKSIEIALKNPIIRNVSLMMISFNIVYHLVDVIHNDSVRMVFAGSPKAMNSYLNLVGKYLGIYAVVFSWLLSGSFVRRFGVFASLLFTPILWSFLSVLDVLSTAQIIPSIAFNWAAVAVPMSLLSFSLILSVGRAAKFTIFDTAKEMSFLSLSLEDKRLGKASVDGLTSRLGKSGGAWIVIITLSHFGSIAASIFPLKVAIFLAYGLWFGSIFSLVRSLPQDNEPGRSVGHFSKNSEQLA